MVQKIWKALNGKQADYNGCSDNTRLPGISLTVITMLYHSMIPCVLGFS